MDYLLNSIRRYLNFPLHVSSISLRENNTWVHQNNRITKIFMTFVFSQENKEYVTKIDDKIIRASHVPRIEIFYPGSVCNTIVPSARHELFFTFEPSQRQMFDLFGFYPCDFSQTQGFLNALEQLKSALENIRFHGVADRIDRLLVELASEAILAAKGKKNAQGNPTLDKRIFNLSHYLDCYFKQTINIDKLIQQQNMTTRTLYRKWHKYYTVSPAQYLINLRIDFGKKLLQNSTLKIYEIAEKCGFCDAMYFSRCFKKKTGLTPKQYRESGYFSSNGMEA